MGPVLAALVSVAIASAASWPRASFALGQSVSASSFPAASWTRVSDPTAAGYCQSGLDAVSAQVKALTTTAMTVVVGGRVLYDYGPQDEVTYLASVRKSLLAMMFGKYVENGTIRLDATMEALGIDDVDGLMPLEKTATVADLLAARSGVYHEAANAACTGCGSTAGDPPGPRGSVKPGTYFLYNNWDFNALGTIFEKATGKDIYVAFEEDFARPMQFQDFQLSAQRKARRPQASQHPAYHFYLSTRDMARIGLLLLRQGDWNGRQLMSKAWVAKMTAPVTPVDQMNPVANRQGPFGYGYLWWIWDGPFNRGVYKGAYTGIGAIGQFITVLPALDMVVAHKTRATAEAVTRPQYLSVLDQLAAARRGGTTTPPCLPTTDAGRP
jgi:CubicO group peptidase (beta-lactamase class C family)